MQHLGNDLRGGIRQLVRRPVYALASMTAFGLGIGLVIAQFAMLNGVAYRGLPFPDADRLIHLERNHFQRGDDNAEMLIHDLEFHQERTTLLEGLAGFTNGTINISDGLNPHRYDGCFASANLFDVLRTGPLIGLNFPAGSDQPGAPPVVIIAHHVWQNDFGGREDIVGQEVMINSMPGTIIGVMAEGFAFPINQEVWMPHRMYSSELSPTDLQSTFEVVGRLKPGVSLEAVEAELSGFAMQLEKQFPDSHEGMRIVDGKPFVREFLPNDVVITLWIMLGLCFMVLAVACTNVANLTLGRVAQRRREMAIRTALGASGRRLMTQMLVESMLLALGGTICGLVVAQFATQWLGTFVADSDPPYWIRVEIDIWTSLFAILVMVAAGLLAGLYPARQAVRVDLNEVLKDAARGSSLHAARFSRFLVGMQIGISIAVLLTTLMMVRSRWENLNFPWPMDTDKVFTARMGLFEGDYPDEAERRQFMDTLLRNAREAPEISAAALGTRYRFSNTNVRRWGHDGRVYEDEDDFGYTRYEGVSDGYFEALGTAVLAGREFTPLDTLEGQPVCLVNVRFAERFFPDQDPIGQRLHFPEDDFSPESGTWRTIVGIAPDLRMQMDSDWEEDHGQGVYVPITESPPRFVTLLARGPVDNAGMALLFRDLVRRIDSNLPLYEMETVGQSIAVSNTIMNMFVVLFSAFGSAATFLAAVGIIGVVSFGVTQRTGEIGIRMAIGATGRRILTWVYMQNKWPWIAGTLGGLFLGFLTTWSLTGRIVDDDFQLSIFDFILVAGFVSLVVGVAILFPARRASRVSPLTALRTD